MSNARPKRAAHTRVFLGVTLAIPVAALAGGSTFSIPWSNLGATAHIASGGDFTLRSTLGHVDATSQGKQTGGEFALTGGVLAPDPPASPACNADINADGAVDVLDLNLVLALFNQAVGADEPADITGDGVVDVVDLNELLGAFGCGVG